MRLSYLFALALLAATLIPLSNFSQATQPAQNDASKGVACGGISVSGWTGQIDAKETAAGLTLNSAKFAKEADAFHVVTGPAVTYWNPKNTASGDYTVSAS